MIARIETQSLAPTDAKHVFRNGAVYALRRLQWLGFSLEVSKDKLSEKQLRFLEQEEITLEPISENDFELMITLDAGQLQAHRASLGETWSAENWSEIALFAEYPPRKASILRKTNETEIAIEVNLYGKGNSEISTGIGFFDHMLDQIAKHSLIDLSLSCKGDLEIDEHHTIEDVGIALGEVLAKAIGDKRGMERFGFVLPMDETQAKVAMDLSGRPYLKFKGKFKREFVGEFPTEMLEHFFYSLAINLKATLHIAVRGDNDHHKVEACFKGFARCLRASLERNARVLNQIPSSKGTL
jgi:imidazoleglycerol-phosphate dehydratase/histidinol-phosphatase